MANKRKQYRVKPEPQDLTVCVTLSPSAPSLEGRIVDLSACGIKVLFAYRCDPSYRLKEVVNLKFISPHLPAPLITPGLVRFRGEGRTGRIYGFEFLDWLGLLTSLPPLLAEMFNQRGDFRVAPDPEEPIPINLENLPLARSAVLRDISSNGLSFLVPSNMETVLREVKTLDISFSLPPSPHRLYFRCQILREQLSEEGVTYGVCFDAKRTEGFHEKQNLVIQYIQRRQRQRLKVLSAQS